MAAPTFTKYNNPVDKDMTQTRFRRYGLLGLSGNYTIVTGIPITFVGILDSSGNPVVLPPTYTGSNGPGQAVPVWAEIASVGGFSIYYDPTAKTLRIWNGTTEVATGAIPAALTAAGIPAMFEFLRG
jgi:hypothetical protein